jgi:inosine-uridine nucleoside N-ribohydrolase
MNLILETDCGHDPDDFFAICYLIAAGVDIRAILISPGDPDQIAIARLILDLNHLDIPIGVSKPNRTKLSSGSIHHDLLTKYKKPFDQKADGLGVDILEDTLKTYPDSELFVIGPVTSIGKYLEAHPNFRCSRATMQGGFLPYSIFLPRIINPDFEGKFWMPTFNLNGDRSGGERFLKANIEHRQMVGKNVCHTVLFSKDLLPNIKEKNTASRLFKEAAELYFDRHSSKKFHDPTAAVCHLHPEIASWIRGESIKMESGWTTSVNLDGDFICADIDQQQLWQHIFNFT